MNISDEARAEADDFVERERQFQLGFLPTEQAHPLTAHFGDTAQRRTDEGIRQLFAVDSSMIETASDLLRSHEIDRLRRSVRRLLETDGRIYFGGCGASGRMSAQLEAMWRRCFIETADRCPSLRDRCLQLADKAGSVVSGGELAVIRSVEYFEDHQSFGRRQVSETGIGPDDLFVALGEAGIAWSTIGMTLEADERGAETYFFYCNPRALMEQNLERCRQLFSRNGICFIEAPFGPMAIAGSTRMQATSLELVCIGYALEWAVSSWATESQGVELPPPATPSDFADSITGLLRQLSEPGAVSGLAGAVEAESEIYRSNGLVTYFADTYLIDILADTTERTPTFALPPFSRRDESTLEPSWAFAKHPFLATPAAWKDLLQRPPTGLDWGSETYRAMNAPSQLAENPPDLSARSCYAYAIGNESDVSRTTRHPAVFLWVDVESRLAVEELAVPEGFDDHYGLNIGGTHRGARFTVPLSIPAGPLAVASHLAVKLIFNVVSTVTAALLGRIEGNWMVHVLPTNKKLVDRSIRILVELKGISYREAARLFFDTWKRMDPDRRLSDSPVAAALRI